MARLPDPLEPDACRGRPSVDRRRSPPELESLLRDRDAYWRRHGLGSALTAFRIPDLHLRRRGEAIELSWDDREWRSVPTGITLAERPGFALMPALEVAELLFAARVIDARSELEAAMMHLGVGVTTLTWQLQNLGWIDEATKAPGSRSSSRAPERLTERAADRSALARRQVIV